jgi:PTS system nitrogen regulatory IIA component
MLHIDDTAKLLSLPKATIRRWIRQGKIPVHEAKGEYFFDKKDLEKWARKHNIFLRAEYGKPQPQPSHLAGNLLEAMQRGGVFFHVKGKTVSEVLRETVFQTPLPPEVDKEFLVDLLLQREKLSSTGIGAGVAIPHPRYPLEKLFTSAVITICFLEKPVDFKAIDGQPVFVLFMMLSPTTKMHLHYLSRLSFCLRSQAFTAFLRKCTEPEAFYKQVQQLESSLDDG